MATHLVGRAELLLLATLTLPSFGLAQFRPVVINDSESPPPPAIDIARYSNFQPRT